MDIAIRAVSARALSMRRLSAFDFASADVCISAGAAALAGERGLRLLEEAEMRLFNVAQFLLAGLHGCGLGL